MRERDWGQLLFSIQQGHCILMLGPEIEATLEPGRKATMPQLLAEELASELEYPPQDRSNLTHIAQLYRIEFGRNDLMRAVVSLYQQHSTANHEFHDSLAALPFTTIISSSQDIFLAEAFRNQGKFPVIERYHLRGSNSGVTAAGSVTKPLIYYLYGIIDEPASLVLTDDDLLDLIVAIVSKNPALPNNIRSEFQNKENSFLFLGFGLKHWYLRILLHVLRLNRCESRSFAFEKIDKKHFVDLEQTVLFYRKGYKIEILEEKVHEFVCELKRRYEKTLQAEEVKETVQPDLGLCPKVFLSYASEDEQQAEKLFQNLREAGFEPWWDKDQLRGGDRWDERIEHVLQDVHYVLVLQSSALLDKSFSYVNKEINIARDRQKYARYGIQFLIPVLIENCSLRPDLQEFQVVNLINETGYGELFSILRRDYQLRLRR